MRNIFDFIVAVIRAFFRIGPPSVDKIVGGLVRTHTALGRAQDHHEAKVEEAVKAREEADKAATVNADEAQRAARIALKIKGLTE